MATLNHLKRNHTASCMAVGLGKLDQHLRISQGSMASSCAYVPENSSISPPAAKRRIMDSVFGVVHPLKEQNFNVRYLLISQQIRELNNTGVLLFSHAEYSMASPLFVQAATLLQSAALAPSRNSTDVEVAPPLKNTSLENPLSSNGTANCSSAPSTTTYIYQRLEFDEGLNIYTNTERVDDRDDPVTVEAILLFNIAQSQRQQENFETAWCFFLRALEVLLSPSGNNILPTSSYSQSSSKVHCIVVAILHNLGLLSYCKGHLQEAIQYYELAVRHGAAIGGSQSVSVGLALNCLGVLHYHQSSNISNSQGHCDSKNSKTMSQSSLECSNKALRFFKEALTILSATLGPDTTAVATCLNNMGRIMVQRDDFASALTFYKQALHIRRRHLGADDLDYAATAFNAGQSLHQLGDYDRAIVLYNEFLRVASMRFNSNHRDVAVVLSGIAQIYQERKEYVKALQLYKESLRVGRAALGNLHSEFAMLLNRVGNFYFERGELDDALECYKEGLLIERAVLKKSHPNIVVTVSNIGEIYREKGDYEKAIELYTEAMELQKLHHGDQSAEVASVLNIIGLIHDQKGENTEALQKLQEALVMRRSVLGDDHLDVSATMTYLGSLFYRRNMISTALQLFTESLRIRRSKLGCDHRDVSFTLYNIGLCHQLQGDYKQSIACFQETLRTEHKVLGKNHRDVVLTLYKLGEAYRLDGDLDMALQNFQRALAIERRLVDKRDPTAIAKTLNEIGNVYLAQGDVRRMMKAFVESARIFRRAGLPVSEVHVSPILKLYAAGLENSAPAA